MKRFNKIALIPAAIAAGLASNAYAGSEACFEVYKVADNSRVTAHNVLFSQASCKLANGSANRGTASANQLQDFDVTSIAYELTGNLDFTLDDVNTANDDMQMVYIPTTDIPSGTVIKIQLEGATWTNNGNQMHLVRQAADGTYGIVASSDGDLDGESEVTFLTKAGITIGAGSRLAFTTDNAIDGTVGTLATGTPATGSSAANDALIVSPKINIKQSGCSPTASEIKIRAVSAITDGGKGFEIAGGRNEEADKLVDISPQFALFEDFNNTKYTSGSAGKVTVEVDAEGTGTITARTRFVNEGDGDFVVDLDTAELGKGAVFPFRMIDLGPSLDQSVALTADHTVKFDLSVKGSESNVGNALYSLNDSWAPQASNTAPGDTLDRIGLVDAWKPVTSSGFTHSYAASAMFANASNDTGTYYAADIANTNDNAVYAYLQNDGDKVMNFNYTIAAKHMLDFGTDAAKFDSAGKLTSGKYINSCVVETDTHSVTVNGAVLKVPYTYETKDNWIRITNEHTAEASITVDIFDESGNTVSAVDLGKVQAKASVVLRSDEILAKAKDTAYGYKGEGRRHTMTFTVTAPKDSVHGVSVQKIPGGVDRVLPVLDQNNWDQ